MDKKLINKLNLIKEVYEYLEKPNTDISMDFKIRINKNLKLSHKIKIVAELLGINLEIQYFEDLPKFGFIPIFINSLNEDDYLSIKFFIEIINLSFRGKIIYFKFNVYNKNSEKIIIIGDYSNFEKVNFCYSRSISNNDLINISSYGEFKKIIDSKTLLPF